MNRILKSAKLRGVIVFASMLIGASCSSNVLALDLPHNDFFARPDPAVEYLAGLRNISIKEAEERSGWAVRAGELNQELISSNITSFGGIWIHPDTDKVVIGTVAGESVAHELYDKVSNYDLTQVVEYVPVQYSFSELLVARYGVIKDADFTESSKGNPFSIEVQTDKNRVVVMLTRENGGPGNDIQLIAHNLKSKYGSIIAVEERLASPRLHACSANYEYCGSPLRGGVALEGYVNSSQTPDGVLHCTAGFGVRGNSGTKYILTAGHCGASCVNNCQGYGDYVWNNDYWRTSDSNYNDRAIGYYHRNVFREGQNIDGMIIKTTDIGNWTAMGKIFVRSGIGPGGFNGPSTNEEYDITGYGTSSGLINERICTSGASFAVGSCGPVRAVLVGYHWDDVFGWFDGLVRAYTCSIPGDSGGPVFRLGKALGIIWGGEGTVGQPCSEYNYYTGLQPILNAFDNTIEIY